MKTLDISKATAPLADYVRDVNKEPVIVTSDGKPVAALVSVKNADLEMVKLSTHPQFIALIEQSRARHKSEGGISSQEMRRRLNLKKVDQQK